MTQDSVKKTPLHDYHKGVGANMAIFGGYEMPMWYPAGVKEEHLAVIERAGIFDTSHMSTVLVGGSDARDLLQHFFSKDLERSIGLKKGPLVVGRCVYGLFLKEDGTVIDDALVYMLGEDSYMVVVNAGMGAPITKHLQSGSFNAEVVDFTSSMGKMDIQGPLSARIVQKLIQNPEDVLASFPYFSFKGAIPGCGEDRTVLLHDGTPLILSRTGYTGEFGFEFFIAREKLKTLWNLVIEAGAEFGLGVCGLAARDSLRAGAVLPLSHQDIGAWVFVNNPWPFALAGIEDGQFTKDFVGADVVLEGCDDDFTYPFVGFDPRKIQGEDAFVEFEGEPIGEILTITTDMAIGRVDKAIFSIASPVESGRPEGFAPKGLSCGFIRVNRELAMGSVVLLRSGKRKIEVEIRQDIRPDRTARRSISLML